MARTSRGAWIALGTITLFAVALRLAYAHELDITYGIRNDAADYARYGFNLSEFGVFSRAPAAQGGPAPVADSFRSPGLPLLVALALKLWQPDAFLRPFLYFQAVLGACAVPLTFLIGRRFLSSRGALAAAVLTALSPHLVTLGGYLLTEALFGVSLLAFVYLVMLALERRTTLAWALAGLSGGWAYLVNEVTLVLVVGLVAALALVAVRRSEGDVRARLWRGLVVLTLTFALFPLAWKVRESVSVGDPVLRGSARAVQTLSHGSYPDFTYKSPEYRLYPYNEDPEQPGFGASLSQFTKVMARRVADRPLRYASWYVFEKPFWLWSWKLLQGDPDADVYVYPVERSLYKAFAPADWTRALMRLLHWPLVLLALFGTFVGLRRLRRAASLDEVLALPLVPSALLVLATVVYSIFACWPRYGVPFRPELYLVAVWGAAAISLKPRSTNSRTTVADGGS